MDSLTQSNSQIIGVGIDLTDVARIKNMLEKYGYTFLSRTFTPAEIEYCSRFSDPSTHYAARFAAKEAMAKALGTGFSEGITPTELSVANDPKTSAPTAVLDGAAAEKMRSLGASKMLVSLTHLKDYAQAFALLVK